jgi:hypothetical protein
MATSKQTSTAKVSYFDGLDHTAKARYLDKLKLIDNVDPYTMSSGSFSADPKYLPPITELNIYNYLVNTPSPYTKDQLECYKGLDAYNQFVSGWVRDVKAKMINNLHLVIGRVRYTTMVCTFTVIMHSSILLCSVSYQLSPITSCRYLVHTSQLVSYIYLYTVMCDRVYVYVFAV